MRCEPFERPADLPVEQWLTRLQSERAELKRTVRQLAHTSRSLGGYYKRIDRIDVTLARASTLPQAKRGTEA